MGKLGDLGTRLSARLAPRLAPLAARRQTWLPLLAAALVLAVLGAALLLTAPMAPRSTQEIDVQGATADQPFGILDADGDQLSDLAELVAGTSPQRADTDGDGLSDLVEVSSARLEAASNTYCPDPLVADADRDCDGDDLGNREELQAGTDPTVADVDGDGLPDGKEVRGGSDPFTPDADADDDGDGLTTLQEFLNGTRADRVDSDLDGLGDVEELNLTRTNPARLSSSGAGVADGWLRAFQLPLDDAAAGFQDPDGDGLTNLEEYLFVARLAAEEGTRRNTTLQGRELLVLFGRGLDPAKNDTDADGMDDGYEVRFGLDPLDDGRADPRLGPRGDPDGDSLLNEFEARAGSNPFLGDSDGDGLSDFDEVTTGWVVKVGDKVRNVTSDPSRADSDGDGLRDLEEKQGKATRGGVELGFPPLDPRSPDTDLDALADLEEITLPVTSGTDPRRLDPATPDTDGDTMLDGDEYRFWLARREGSGSEFEEVLDRVARQMGEAAGESVTRDQALAALGPGGDLDGDGKPNLLDRDADADTLDDGKEQVPDDKPVSEGSRIRRPLPATDPALVDTDGEGLPDPWEHQFAQYDFGLGDWNLNASARDSLKRNDGKTDADRDLDGDGVLYNGTGYARRVSYSHTNLFEYLSGTHPNLLDTDGDGLPDGWETYFTCVTAVQLKKGCGTLAPLPREQVDVVVDLDPALADADRDGRPDGNETSEATPYTRFAFAPPVPPVLDLNASETSNTTGCTNQGPSDLLCDVFPNVVRIHGLRKLLYRDEFAKGLDPSVHDTDGDAMADGFELAAGLNPLGPEDANQDLDADGLANIAEWEKGTDPKLADTDLGQLEDGKDPNPLYPPDDAPEGDTDCDGVQNKDEAPRGSSLADFDSDRDGLLDGPGIAFFATAQTDVMTVDQVRAREGCTLTAAELRERFVARGIAQSVPEAGKSLFLGETLYGTSPSKADTDDDRIPDGWEAYWVEVHGLRAARDPIDAGFFADGDSLNNTAEYRSGMPPGWEGGGCGVWWLGTDPRSGDTDGDGARDGTVLDGATLGGADADFDLDNDGLSDFTGEDPAPLFDPANTLASPLGDCSAYARFVERWIFQGGRKASATEESQPGVKRFQDYARTKLADLAADLDPDGALPPDEAGKTIVKGGRFLVRGRVVVDGLEDNGKPVAGAVVLVNLGAARSGRPEDVLGVATTGSDGRFVVEASVNKTRAVNLTAPAVLFGAPRAAGSRVAWAPDTAGFPPDAGYKVTVWTTARQEGPAGPYGFQASKPGGGTFDARGVLGSAVTSAPGSGAFDLPLLTLKSDSRLEVPPRPTVTAGDALTVRGSARDGLGDPLPKEFLENGLLRVRFLGALHVGPPGLRVQDGGFVFEVAVDANTTLGTHPLEAVYDGFGGLVGGSRANASVGVKYPTNITGRVLNEGLRAVADEDLVVEGQVRDAKGNAVPPGLPVEVRLQGSAVRGNTTSGGRYRVLAEVPATATVGTQNVEVAFLGSATYAESTGDAGFVTLVQKTEIAIRGGRSPVGRDLVVTGTLKDLAGSPVDDPTEEGNTTLRVTTPAGSGDANVTGTEWRFTVPKEALPGAGPFAVRAEFAGTRLYDRSTSARELQLSSRTTLSLEAAEVPRGRPAQLAGKLVDEKGRGLAGERVLVTLGNDTAEVRTADDGAFARPVQLPRDHALGGLLARAEYQGGRNGLLDPAEPVRVVVQVVAATTLTVPPRTVSLGTLPVNGTLVDDRGQPVPGAKLEIRLDNVTLGFAVTDLQGRFETEVAPREGTAPGTHVLRVRFGGSGTLAADEAAVAYRLLAPSKVAIERVGTLVRGSDGLVVAKLTDLDGVVLAARPVELLVEGTPVGVAATDASGVARILGKPPGFLAPGNVTVEVRFAGDDGYMPSRASQRLPLTVRTELQVDLPALVEAGQVFRGGIVVRDDAGRPLVGEVVVVTFTGYRIPIALTTDAGGRANFTGRMEGPGLGAMTVRYPGGEGLAPAEAAFTVQSRTPLLAGPGLLGVLVLAAAVVVAAAMLLAKRLRRAQVGEVQRFLAEAEQRLIASTEYQASILWAYRRVVDLMRGQGFLVKESFTPRELLEAMAAAMPAARGHLEGLVGVFEEARYSPHPIGPAHRDQALAALRGIERDLRMAQAQGKLAPPPEVADG